MKTWILVMSLFTFVLSACGAPAEPTVQPSPQIIPTDTSVPTATIIPTPTIDPLIFKDDFEGALDAQWVWEKENKKMWSLENNPGWLEITAGSGGVASRNLLKRPLPEGDFDLETKMVFEPLENYQIAGLIVFYNANNYILFGRAYAEFVVGDGFYMDYFKSGQMAGDNFATPAPGTDTIYLRLRKIGDLYTSFYSEDGLEWIEVGQHTSDMQAKFIGLAAGQSTKGSVPAQFDYFLINQVF